MAKLSLWQRFKKWITGGSSGGSSPSRRVVNNRDSRSVTSSNTSARRAYINAFKGSKDDLERDTVKDAWSKTKSAFKASSSKATPDPKEAQKSKSKKDTKDYFKAELPKQREAYHKATNHRYDVDEKGISDKEKQKRRQNVKSRAFDADTAKAEAKHAMKYHKYGESLARGGISGATFGASDLLAKYGTKGEAKKAEEIYQKKKSKGAETAGEIAGSLAAFGLTSGASSKVVGGAAKKIAPKALAKAEGKAIAKLAGTKAVRKAAEKEVANAVKKGIAKEATEEAVSKVAKQKAKEVVANLGADAAINATTGKIYSATSAAKESENAKDFAKNFAKNEAANLLLSSTATVGLPAAGKGIKRALGGVSEGAEKALAKAEPPKVKVGLKRRNTKKTDLLLPQVRNMDNIDDKLDFLTEDDLVAIGLSRAEAQRLVKSVQGGQPAEEAAQIVAASKNGLKKGNIKPLAESLKRNEFIPRSRNAEWRIPPRSAERVDTSIEGLSKNLDELKKQNPKTEREQRALETKIHDVEDRLNRAEWRKEGGANMGAMRKAYKGEYEGFDMSKSTNSKQSDALEGKLKGKTATIVEMSPDEYMERAYRQIFKKPSEKGKVFADIPEHSEDIAKYAEAMRNGEKFPLPYLDYGKNGGQEGRHRALAANSCCGNRRCGESESTR